MPTHPYRRFTGSVVASGSDAEGDFFRVRSTSSGQLLRLEAWELKLAECFDGAQDPAQRLASAHARLGRELRPGELEAFANELALAGLLEAGDQEPLPVPPQTLREQQSAWQSPGAADPAGEDDAVPPSTMPGTLSGSGRGGAIGGSHGSHRGEPTEMDRGLPPRAFAALGRLLCWPLWLPPLPWLLVLLAAGAFWGLWDLRVEAAREALRLAEPLRLLGNALTAALLINVLTQSARLAAIRRASGEWPAFGVRRVAGVLPALFTDTEGPAERAGKADRGRILLSAPLAVLWLFLLSALGWFATRGGAGLFANICFGWMLVSAVVLALRLNPLARLDGYYWLAHRVDIPDLREQAVIRLFGFQRPWSDTHVASGRVLLLYGIASLAWVVTVLALILIYPGRWIAGGFGGTGVLVFAIAVSLLLWSNIRRVRSRRGDIGGGLRALRRPVEGPSARQWLLIGAAAILALWPYRFEPAGRATLLPAERAEVRATLPGEVRQVMAREGDLVAAGEILVELSNGREEAQVDMSRGEVRRLEAQLRLAKAGAAPEEVAAAEQRVATARERYAFASAEARRAQRAFRQKAISQQDHEAALANAAVRAQELAEAEAALAVVLSGTREENIEALKAELDSARAQLAFHQQQLEDTRLRAPIGGRVVSGELLFALGKYLERGDLIATIEASEELQAEILLPESAATEITTGAEVRLRVWSQPLDSIHGQVQHIAPAAEESEYGRVVRVIARMDTENAQALLPGLSGQAKIAGRRYPAAVVFTRALLRFVTVQIWSWLP